MSNIYIDNEKFFNSLGGLVGRASGCNGKLLPENRQFDSVPRDFFCLKFSAKFLFQFFVERDHNIVYWLYPIALPTALKKSSTETDTPFALHSTQDFPMLNSLIVK